MKAALSQLVLGGNFMKRRIIVLMVLALIGPSLFILNCQESSPESPVPRGTAFKAPAPSEFSEVSPSAISDLFCEAIMDGNLSSYYRQGFTVGAAPNYSCNGSIPNIKTGRHTFTLMYYIQNATYSHLIVALQTCEVTVQTGTTVPCTFLANGFTVPDDDNDGWTNLKEIANATNPKGCTDSDTDGYFAEPGSICGMVQDCNDNSAAHWNDCAVCIEADGDGRGLNCNLGPDCDDGNINSWNTCGTCIDSDGDSYVGICNAYYGILGPDCADNDPDNWVSCAACRDNDLDTWFVGCDAYTNKGGAEDCDDTSASIYPGNYGSGSMTCLAGGTFDMGSTSGGGECQPVHPVHLSSFQIDRGEVTVGQYKQCVSAGQCATPPDGAYCSNPDQNPSLAFYYTAGNFDSYPVINVSWNDANDYCAWKGEHLPTEAQWEYAARGGLPHSSYPWGDGIGCGQANYGLGWAGYECDTNLCWPGTNPYATATSYPQGSYQLFNITGNVMEWVFDYYKSDYYQDCFNQGTVHDPTGPVGSFTEHGIRGGQFHNYSSNVTVYFRSLGTTSDRTWNLGFRCAK